MRVIKQEFLDIYFNIYNQQFYKINNSMPALAINYHSDLNNSYLS